MKTPLRLTLLCLAVFVAFRSGVHGQQTVVDNIDIQAINQGLFNGGLVTVIEDTFFLFKDNGGSFTGFVPVGLDKLCLPQAAVNTLNDAISFINTTLTLFGLNPVALLTEACFGPDVDIKFGYDLDAYFRTLMSAGDVDIIYPLQATIHYPDPGTVLCNDYMVIQTSAVPQPGYDMVLQEPEMDFALGVRLRNALYLNGEICAFACFPIGTNGIAIPPGFATATPGNYKSKLGGGDTDFFGLSTTTGIKFPWDYSPFIPKPSGFPNLTLPLNTALIPNDPVGNYANIYGTLDNPFGTLNDAEKTVNGNRISATHAQPFISISFDPIQFQEYITGVPLTIYKSLGGGVTVTASVLSFPFIVDATQIHQFNFDFDDVNIHFTLSAECFWKEVTPGGDTIRSSYGALIENFTIGNQLLVVPEGEITISPAYTISSNTFMTNIFQQLQFSWAYKILDVHLTFPAINGGTICNNIIGGLNIPHVVIEDIFNPTQWCPCLPLNDPNHNPNQPVFCIGQWACEFAQITLRQIVLDACNGVVNIVASGQFSFAALSDTIALGPPIPLPPFVDSSMFTLTFTPVDGTSINVSPDATPPIVTPVTEFIWTGGLLKIHAIDLIEPIPHTTARFTTQGVNFIPYSDCAALGTRSVNIIVDNNCSTQTVPVTFTVKELIPPDCADVRSDTIRILAGTTFGPSSFWTGPRDRCSIFFDHCTVSPNTFTCAQEGVHEVTLTLRDFWGNTSICHAYVDIYGFGNKYYVDENATGLGHGRDWANAFNTLQEALTLSCSGTSIYMAEGTYYPTDGSDQTISHMINNAITIYGGFSPSNNVTSLAKRDWVLYPTILSGDIDHDGLLDAENSQSVLVVSGNAVFDGLIIEHGYADGSVIPHNRGGGIFNTSSSLFRNCVFRKNWAPIGGAVYNLSGAPTFINCVFYDNIATTNSSVLSPANGNPTMVNCVIAENTSPSGTMNVFMAHVTLTNCIFWSNGGDLVCSSSGTVTVNHTLLQDASLPVCAVDGGGNIYAEDPLFEDAPNNNFRLTDPSPAVNSGNNGPVTFALDFDQNNRIFQNDVDMGAFEFQCPEEATPTTLVVTNAVDGGVGSFKNLVEQYACPGDTIVFDPALNGIPLPVTGDQIDMAKDIVVIGNGYENTIIDGGQSTRILRIYDDANVEIRDMAFINGNTINHGGALYTEGNVSIDRCLFSANQATGNFNDYVGNNGGAIYVAGGQFTGSHLVITGNKGRIGGGFACADGTATLYHCTLAGNYSTLAGGGMSQYPDGILTLYNSVVWGNYSAFGGFGVNAQTYGSFIGSGNLTNNVSFVDPIHAPDAPILGGDYQLTLAEPGINSGNNNFVADTVDFLGNPRILNGIIDPGAYERTGCGIENYNLYVDISAPGGGDGLSWGTAFNSLQDALDVLNATDCTVTIDSVLVAEGNYFYVDGLIVTVFFIVNRPTVLIGGYPAGGGERDWIAHPTVLDAYYGNQITNHPTVIEVRDNAEINGFIIQNGEAGLTIFPDNPNLGFYYVGGGIINKANAIYRNCIIKDNTALYGAGLYSYNGDILVENCVFYGNVADHPDQNNGRGSAVYIADGNATFVNNTFNANPGDPTNSVLYFRNGTHSLVNSIVWEEDIIIGTHEDATVNASHNIMKYHTFDGIVNADVTNMYGQDPLFVNTAGRDYKLLPCSPAIDAGDMSVLIETGDFFGNPRVYGPEVDLGFHEVQSPFIMQRTVAYVDSSVTVSGDGMSWATAYQTLMEALDANANCGVDTILVATGTYYPTNTADRTLSHASYNDLVILGGYPAGGGVRNWAVNKTILSGDINQSGNADTGDSYTVLTSTGNLELNGIIIEGGFADGTGSLAENGAGIHSSGGLKIYNSIIRDNHAPANLGGGIYHFGPSLEMVNVLVHDNSGERLGAAIHLEGSGSYTLTNCTIADNISDTDATAVVYNSTNQTGLFRNCIFWNPGEGEIRNSNTNTLANSIIEGGKPASVLNGGGISAASPSFTNVTMRDYTLRPCSPATDAGLSPIDLSVFSKDAGALSRSQNITVDMGAFELQGIPMEVSDHVNIYVDLSAPPGGDGYSWATAYQSLLAAISHETTIINCENVDTIFVAEGSYLPTTSATPDARFEFPSGSDLVLMGGYPAGGGMRDFSLYETILDGDIAGAVNSYTVVYNQGKLTLDGITVANGRGRQGGGTPLQRDGAGIYNTGDLVLNNCVVRDNSNANSFGEGSGVFQGNGGSLVINNSLFYNNIAANFGGAIHRCSNIVDCPNTPGTRAITIRNSTFYGNRSNSQGNHSIYIMGDAPVTCYNSIFWNADAPEFGNNISAVSLQNSVIEEGVPGTATDLGGNISSYPEFVLGGDYSLKPCSPAINAGSNSFIPFLSEYDLGYQQRVSQGTIDIGAYEYAGPDSYVDSTQQLVICSGDSVFLEGSWQHFAGVYLDTIMSVDCDVNIDTALATTLTVLQTGDTTLYSASCLFMNTGVTMDTITGGSSNGCDSIVTTRVAYLPPSPEIVYALVCDAEDIGIIRDTLFGGAANGCDSIVIFINSIRRLFPPVEVEITCGDSILIGGQYRKLPGIYNDTLQTDMGCDSIVPKILSLTLPDKYYVDHTASGLSNGLDWVNAFPDLQSALHNFCLKAGDSIFIAEGTYYPDEGGGMIDGDRNAEFSIPPDIVVMGGYPSGGGDRDISTYTTVLSGDLGQDDLSAIPVMLSDIVGDNAFTVVYINEAVLDGVTITAGHSNQQGIFPSRRQRGAGLVNTGDSQIRNCIITGNHATGSGMNGIGAGVFHLDGDAQYSNCLVVRNTATGQGGGFNCAFGNPMLINCTIAYNTDGGVQGGIAGTSAHIAMVNSILWGNDDQTAIIGTGSIAFANSIMEGTIPIGVSYINAGENTTQDPLFIDIVNNDFHVHDCLSPANDGGRNDLVTDIIDLDQNLRIQGNAVDIGVYENAGHAPVVVTTTLNDGLGSLRAVIADVCANGIVQFDPGLATETIQLTGNRILLGRNVKILGLGMDNLYISGEATDRVFEVAPGRIVRIEELNVLNGHPTDGIILNQGHLIIKNVRIQN